MSRTRTHLLTGAMIATAALAFGGCGASDEEQIRDAVAEFQQVNEKQQWQRACELLTARAEAQMTALFGGGVQDCARALSAGESDDGPAELSARAIAKAPIQLRGDRALLRAGKDGQAIGLRKVDGDWQIDNFLNATLVDKPVRFDARLSAGSDEQQVRATQKAVTRAFARRDYEQACTLFSYGAEAQLVFAAAFASILDTDAGDKQPSRLTCAWALGKLERIAGGKGFADELASDAQIDAGRVAIRGDRATVHMAGEDDEHLVRQDGRWMIGPDPEGFSEAEAPSAASLKRCWQRSGARIATRAADLRFAVGSSARNIAISPGRVSVKGDDWRIFYTVSDGGEDPGLRTILERPSTARAVAYVRDAGAHPGVVARARACGD